MPVAARRLTSCATCWNCWPMFVPGNTVAPDEWPNPLNIPFNSVPSARASLAACTSESPLLHETITWSAWTFAAAALAGHALMPSPARFKPREEARRLHEVGRTKKRRARKGDPRRKRRRRIPRARRIRRAPRPTRTAGAVGIAGLHRHELVRVRKESRRPADRRPAILRPRRRLPAQPHVRDTSEFTLGPERMQRRQARR